MDVDSISIRVSAIYEDGAQITEYGYDILGRQVRATNANGVVQTTAYNLAGLPTSVRNENGSGIISEDLRSSLRWAALFR